MEIKIKLVTVKELFSSSNWDNVVSAYINESNNKVLPKANVQEYVYQELEDTGMFKVIAAYEEDKLVGFIMASFSILPHYLVKSVSTSAIFVLQEYRNTNTTKRLLNTLEDVSRKAGIKAFIMTAPKESRLEKAARIFGFTATNTLFTKVLS